MGVDLLWRDLLFVVSSCLNSTGSTKFLSEDYWLLTPSTVDLATHPKISHLPIIFGFMVKSQAAQE